MLETFLKYFGFVRPGEEPTTPEYQAFVTNFLEAKTWATRKDGVPLSLLDALSDTDKAKAERALLQRLSLGDDWPTIGLGHLKSTAAGPRLRQMLAKAEGSMKATIATALWKIDRDDSMADIVIKASVDCYTDEDDKALTYQMIDIILCLCELPQERVRARLEALTKSGNYLVASNARRILRQRDRG
jgi:hypothetical protein